MKRIISVLLATVIVALTLNAIHEVNTNNRMLHLKEIKLRNVQVELEKLDKDYKLLQDDHTKTQEEKDAEIQRLLEREEELQRQLQAKRLIKEQQAKAYAAVAPRFGGDCASWIQGAGITDIVNATELIRRESGCNAYAVNRSSGACGVAQELPCGKSGCSLGNGACQVKWMANYVAQRYGSWANAVAFHNSNNWY